MYNFVNYKIDDSTCCAYNYKDLNVYKLFFTYDLYIHPFPCNQTISFTDCAGQIYWDMLPVESNSAHSYILIMNTSNQETCINVQADGFNLLAIFLLLWLQVKLLIYPLYSPYKTSSFSYYLY